MTKTQLAALIDAYADAKASGNKHLIQTMIAQLEDALNEVCEPGAPEEISAVAPTEVLE